MRPHILKAITDHAQAEYPNECCGLVIQNSQKQRYIPCHTPPIHPQSNSAFTLKITPMPKTPGRLSSLFTVTPMLLRNPASQLDIAQCDLSQLSWVTEHYRNQPDSAGFLLE
ncbi:peptidase P60 [Xenorhabdus mauleonii]|uniref:Peptidase P60 n=1 Tax=Xenorhabdus mauleonii TaxID=351675 RepID=A0A1I3WRQ7_9GAMM|nr:peptidase P60 [Xenorhabdus mauleonii]SFK10195.1 Proteasome lid subunit RPN8/RPN11, contains Jab1/MPN metalloenzyme (JAMM) motif [Xenorhabdus mauleonii]